MPGEALAIEPPQEFRAAAERLHLRDEVIDEMEADLVEDRARMLPIPLFRDDNQTAGAIERIAYPADLPDDHKDPDATVARVNGVGVLPRNQGLLVNLELNPWNLLTNQGVEIQSAFTNWNLTFSSNTARMWGTAVATSSTQIWDTWITSGTTSITVNINEHVWNQWVTTTDTVAYRPLVAGTGFYPAPRTAEQTREAEEVAAQERARYAEMQRERDEAARRATDLLRSALDDDQEAELLTHARFLVRSQKGKTYRIRKGWSHSVDLIEKGVIKGTYCIHPRETVPEEDSMLAQKLMLESAEDDFLRIANYSPSYAQRLA